MRIVARAVLAVMITGFFACATPRDDGDTPTEIEAEGFRLLDQGRHEEGLQKFREAVRSKQGSFLAMVGMALAHVRAGDTGMFESFAIEASRVAPPTDAAFDRLGTMYVSAAETCRSRPPAIHYARLGVEFLRRVFVADPNRPGLLFHLGLGLDLSGDARGALYFLERAHALAPHHDDVLFALCRVLRSLQTPERLRALLDERAAKGPLGPEWQTFRLWLERRTITSMPTSAPIDG